MFKAEDFAAKSIEEYRERQLANARDSGLKDGERRMLIHPGFDLRNTADSQYGQASPTLIFMERRGNVIIDCSFFMGWNVLGERSLSMDGRDISVMGRGFYYHRLYKKDVKYPEYARHDKCSLFDGRVCWCEAGSALYGDKLKWVLMNEGDSGIWREIDEAFKEYSL
jgi:hypothetical protein